MRHHRLLCVLLITAGLCQGVLAQNIDQSRGVDPRVDYESLTRYGPWDDRNYGLMLEDIELLAPNEHELKNPIPAFFRVEMRRENPHYLRSGLPVFPKFLSEIVVTRDGDSHIVSRSNRFQTKSSRTLTDRGSYAGKVKPVSSFKNVRPIEVANLGLRN